MKTLVSAALLLSSAVSIGGASINGLLKKSDILSTGQDWLSVAPGAEVQPADFSAETPQVAAMMKNTLDRMLYDDNDRTGDYDTIFLDGSQTYYDEYAQAWRLLGFFIDCDAPEYDERRRNLEGENDYNIGCRRYLLWAAVSLSHVFTKMELIL